MADKGTVADLNELLALRCYAGNIQFFNSQRVNTSQVGNHMSRARGKGMDFEEVRVYQPGDDIRLIHWPLTAKLEKPYTKIYKEERERSIYFVIDQSTTMRFGSRVCFKSVLVAKLTALLGWAALQHHEQVGGIIFNEQSSMFISPKRSRKSLLSLFKQMTDKPALNNAEDCDLNTALQQVLRRIRSGSVVVVISDFMGIDEQTKTYLKLLSKGNEVINLFTYDPLEARLPKFGYYNFTDGDNKLPVNANNTKQRRVYEKTFTQRVSETKDFSQQCNMQFVSIATNDDLVSKINHGIMRYGY